MNRSTRVALLASLLVAATAVWLARMDGIYLEKALTQLLLPCGLIWLLLLLHCFWLGIDRRYKACFLACTITVLYTVAGSGLVGHWLIRSLEKPFQPVDYAVQGEPFDVLVVLGGGTVVYHSGEVALGDVGDRVMAAARLFLAGRVRTLVATGAYIDKRRVAKGSYADAAEKIWIELGVPADRIVKLGGRNTSEEMLALKALPELAAAARVGLLSSAWHLHRAMRLAAAQGMRLIPVPADFRSRRSLKPWPLLLIPEAPGFLQTHMAAREYMASLVGR